LGGSCYLRYDDTNPDKETHEFIEEIENNIKWLGYEPDKVTFASDYFEELQYYAHQLIRNGQAYVCESTQEEIELERKEKRESPYRSRPIEESLRIFPHLTGSQTLRLKGVPDSPNPTLRDPIIYRQKSTPHPRTGSKFKIYPTYDYTHGICDSLQHIDYSLCSLEF
jgi:glutaminyl-tRNA synthetase